MQSPSPERATTFSAVQEMIESLRHGKQFTDSKDFQVAALRTEILTRSIFHEEMLRHTQSHNMMKRVRVTSGREILMLPSYEEFQRSSLAGLIQQQLYNDYGNLVDDGRFLEIYDKAVKTLFKPQRVRRPHGAPPEEFEEMYPEETHSTYVESGATRPPPNEDATPEDMDEENLFEAQRAHHRFNLQVGDELQNMYTVLMTEIRAAKDKKGIETTMAHDALDAFFAGMQIKTEVLEMVDNTQEFVFAMIREIDQAFSEEAELIPHDDEGLRSFSQITRATIRKLEEMDDSRSPESAAGQWIGILADFNRFALYAQNLAKTMRDTWKIVLDISVSESELRRAWGRLSRMWRNTRFSYISLILQFLDMFPFLKTSPGPSGSSDDNTTIYKVVNHVLDMMKAIEKSHKPKKKGRLSKFGIDPSDEREQFEKFLQRGRHRDSLRAVLKSYGIVYERKRSWAESIRHYTGKILGAITAVTNSVKNFAMFMWRYRFTIIGTMLFGYVIMYGYSGYFNKTGYTSMKNPALRGLFFLMKALCGVVQTEDTQWITGSIGIYITYTILAWFGTGVKLLLMYFGLWKLIAKKPKELFQLVVRKVIPKSWKKKWVKDFRQKLKLPGVCCGMKLCMRMDVQDELSELAAKANESSADFDFAFNYEERSARRQAMDELADDDDITDGEKEAWCANLPDACGSCMRMYMVRCRRFVDCSGLSGGVKTMGTRLWENKGKVGFGLLGFFGRSGIAYYLTAFWKNFASLFCHAMSEINAIFGAADTEGAGVFQHTAELTGAVAYRSAQNTRALAEATADQMYKLFTNIADTVVDAHSKTGFLALMKKGAHTVISSPGYLFAGGFSTLPGALMDATGYGLEYAAPGVVGYYRNMTERFDEHDRTSFQVGDVTIMGPHAVGNAQNDVTDYIEATESRARVMISNTVDENTDGTGEELPTQYHLPSDSRPQYIDKSVEQKWPQTNAYLRSLDFTPQTNLQGVPMIDVPGKLLKAIENDPELRGLISAIAKNQKRFTRESFEVRITAVPRSYWEQATDLLTWQESDPEIILAQDTGYISGEEELTDEQSAVLNTVRDLLPGKDAPDTWLERTYDGANEMLKMLTRQFFEQEECSAEEQRAARNFLFDDSERVQNTFAAIADSYLDGELRDMYTTYAGAGDTSMLYIFDTNGYLTKRIPTGSVRTNRAWGTRLLATLDALDEETLAQFHHKFGTDYEKLMEAPMSDVVIGFIEAASGDDLSLFDGASRQYMVSKHALAREPQLIDPPDFRPQVVVTPTDTKVNQHVQPQHLSNLVPININNATESGIFTDLANFEFNFGEDDEEPTSSAYPPKSKLRGIDCRMHDIFCVMSPEKAVEHAMYEGLAERGIYVFNAQGFRDAIMETTAVGVSKVERGAILSRIDEVTRNDLPAHATKPEVLFHYIQKLHTEARFVVYKDGSWSQYFHQRLFELGHSLNIAAANAVNVGQAALVPLDPRRQEHAYEVVDTENMTRAQYVMHSLNEFVRMGLGGKARPAPDWEWSTAGASILFTHVMYKIYEALLVPLGVTTTMIHVIRENDPTWVSGSAYTVKEIIGLFELLYQAVYGRKDFMQAHRRLRKFSVMARFLWHLDNKMLPAFREIRTRFGSLSDEMVADMIYHINHSITTQELVNWSQPNVITTLTNDDLIIIHNAATRIKQSNPNKGEAFVLLGRVAEEQRRRGSTQSIPMGKQSDVQHRVNQSVGPSKSFFPYFKTKYPQFTKWTTQQLKKKSLEFIRRLDSIPDKESELYITLLSAYRPVHEAYKERFENPVNPHDTSGMGELKKPV